MGTVHAVKAVLEGMTEREEGIIVVTSSLAALFGIYGYPAYTCSKFGLRGFAETLRMEVRIRIVQKPNKEVNKIHSIKCKF